MCANFKLGKCNWGKECNYAHRADELKVAEREAKAVLNNSSMACVSVSVSLLGSASAMRFSQPWFLSSVLAEIAILKAILYFIQPLSLDIFSGHVEPAFKMLLKQWPAD